jgi:HCOMODA/2-hydroxy-3-carboxy-muconic semialdehyde decarboxylase
MDPTIIEDLVAGSRILADQNILDAFGHVSIRHPTHPDRYLMSRNLAPALVTADDIIEYDLDSNPLNDNGRRSFLERFIHGEIYRARHDVKAVVHTHSPAVIPFGVTQTKMMPISQMGSFLASGVPVFEIRNAGGMTNLLVSNNQLGKALAATLGNTSAALLRGHGNVVVGPSIQIAVARAIYMEGNARLQVTAMALGGPITYVDKEEAELFDTPFQQQIQRPWELWKSKVMKVSKNE